MSNPPTDPAPSAAAAGAHETEHEQQRRDFLMKLSLGVGGVVAACVAVPVATALLAPLLETKPESWRPVGALAEHPVGSTKLVKFENTDPKPWSGESSQSAAWLRRDSETAFTAFAVNCSHLGCPVRWEEGAGLFMCPCHGGIYYKDGTVAAGPPPRPLSQYKTRIVGQQVELLTAPIPITTITS